MQVAEDGGDDVGVENEGDDEHFTATSPASEWVDLEDPLQQFCPALSGCPQRWPIESGAVGGGQYRSQRSRVRVTCCFRGSYCKRSRLMGARAM
jgi:hypothetical protein